jgi:hypothetical protein
LEDLPASSPERIDFSFPFFSPIEAIKENERKGAKNTQNKINNENVYVDGQKKPRNVFSIEEPQEGVCGWRAKLGVSAM